MSTRTTLLVAILTLAPTTFGAVRATAACGTDLQVLDDGSGLANELVISEINPGDYIEIFNASDNDIVIDAEAYEVCSPFIYAALTDLIPGIVVQAKSYVVLPWPAGFSDTDAGGEILLYRRRPFMEPMNIMDFVCWGTNPHGSRKGMAEGVGKWTGDCAGAITSGSINRLASTTGVLATNYRDAAPSPLDCLFADSFESGDFSGWDSTVGVP